MPPARTEIKAGKQAAIRSDTSGKPGVHAVCHHSRRYLTRREAFPHAQPWLRRKHEFPGMPWLDRSFAYAAHDRRQHHLILTDPMMQGITALVGGLLLILPFLVNHLWPRVVVWWSRLVENRIGTAAVQAPWSAVPPSIGGFFVIGLALTIFSIWRFSNREHHYHWSEAGKKPTVLDYPLRTHYRISVDETITADLAITEQTAGAATSQGRVKVALTPDESSVRDFSLFRQLYDAHGGGKVVDGGLLALVNLAKVKPDALTTLDRSHRLLLRATPPPLLEKKLYQASQGPLLEVPWAYELSDRALYGQNDERKRFVLDCVPSLRDSRTLELRFRWHGDKNIRCVIEECARTWQYSGARRGSGLRPLRSSGQARDLASLGARSNAAKRDFQ